MLLKLFLTILILFSVDLFAQVFPNTSTGSATDIYTNPYQQMPPQNLESVQNQNYSLNDVQKTMLLRAYDHLTDREVDEYLKNLGYKTNGSIYAKRKRLRDILGIDKTEKAKDSFPLSLQKNEKDSSPSITIENASEGELMSVDKTKSGVMILRGRVKLKIGNTGSLVAGTVILDSKRKEVYAENDIEYRDGPLKVKGERFIYDYGLNRGVIYETKATVQPAYFIGKKLKKIDEHRYLLDMGHFTACNAEVPHYRFKAGKMILHDDQTFVATNLWYEVGGTNLFVIPLFYYTNLGSGWTFQFGKNQSRGVFLQGNYQYSEPMAAASVWAPVGRKIKVDWNEKSGQAIGLDFWKVSPWLTYNLSLGFADYKKYEVANSYENRLGQGAGISNVVTTNQVDRGDLCIKGAGGKCVIKAQELLGSTSRIRDIGEQNQSWYKLNFFMNARKNFLAADGTRNVIVQADYYNTNRYEYEFGYRYQPTMSLQSLYTRRNQRLPFFRPTTTQSLDYSENRGDLNINVLMRRVNNYFLMQKVEQSGYFPIIDEMPRIAINNNSQIANIPYFDTPLYSESTVKTAATRFYGFPTKEVLKFPVPPDYNTDDPWGQYKQNLLRTQYLTNAETGLKSNLYLGSLFTYTPAVYVGGMKQSADMVSQPVAVSTTINGVSTTTYAIPTTKTTSEIALERNLKRDSYLYMRNDHKLSFGIPMLMLTANYRKVEAYKPELEEKVLGKNRVHELELSLESNYFQDFDFAIKTIRDLRTFADGYKEPNNQQRWYFTIVRLGGYYDFLEGTFNKKSTLLERQRSFYAGTFANNDFVYHTPLKKALYNHFTAGFQLGGFSIPLIRNVKSLEIGGSWYHVYHAQFLDSYRIYMKADLQVTQNWGFEFDVDSRVSQPWRYTDQTINRAGFNSYGTDFSSMSDNYNLAQTALYSRTSFEQDLVNATGVNGQEKKQNTAYNIHRLMWVLKYNLHDFEYRIGYGMDLRSIAGGPSLDNQINFYDQSVFFTISLLNVDLGEVESSGARARVYRFKKRALDRAGGYRGSIVAE